MLFDFSQEQYDFRDAVRAMLDKEFPAGALRAVWDSPDSPDRLWGQLADQGLTALLVPEEQDGLGGDFVDFALPLEEIGFAAVPGPLVETAFVAAPVLAAHGKGEWLPRIASGEAVISLSATGTGLVRDAALADAVLVLDGDATHLVTSFDKEAVSTMDPALRMSRCTFAVSADTLISDDPAVAALTRDAAAIGSALVLVGLSRRMLEMTQAYLVERKQFGRLIGSFQALKHRLADVAVAVEAARGLAWHGAYALANLPEDRPVAAAMAKASAGRAAYLAGSAALQLHGGIGFTWEHDLHLWLQRGKALEALYGSTDQHRERTAAHALGSNA